MAKCTLSTLLLLVPICGGFISAQNLAPNPGFESRNSCPTSISQFNNYVQTWVTANTASTDYSGCGFTGNSAIQNVPASGQSSAGMWGGASHPSCSNTAYSEAIRANLLSPMLNGATYQVQFQVRVDPSGSSTANPSNCVDFGVYFYNTASPPPMTGWCCHPVTPQFSVAAGSIPRGPYATFTGTVVAANWNAMIIGPFCNSNTNTGACSNYNTARMYFNLDNVVVQPQVVLEAADMRLEGKAHPSFHALHWEVDPDHAYTRFSLERSHTGTDFEPVDERLAEPGRTLYQYLDRSPAPGLNFYRLTGHTANGETRQTAVVILLRGDNGNSEGGPLNFYHDAATETLHFSLDAGPGGPLRLELLDMQGRQVIVTGQTAGEGIQQFSFPVGEVARGLYILRVRALQRDAVWQGKWVR